jgi:hypothetical protein
MMAWVWPEKWLCSSVYMGTKKNGDLVYTQFQLVWEMEETSLDLVLSIIWFGLDSWIWLLTFF